MNVDVIPFNIVSPRRYEERHEITKLSNSDKGFSGLYSMAPQPLAGV